VAKKHSLRKLKLLKKEEGFWSVINVLGSIIKLEKIRTLTQLVYRLRIPKDLDVVSAMALEVGIMEHLAVPPPLTKSSINQLFFISYSTYI